MKEKIKTPKKLTIEDFFSKGFCFKESSKIENLKEEEYNIKNIDQITEIRVNGTNLTEIPDFLWNFKNLKKLDFNQNQITKIKNIDSLLNLTHLDLENNQINKIEGLDNLYNLTTLNLYSNKLKKIENIHHLINIEYLYLDENLLKYSKYPHLEYINTNLTMDIEIDIENNRDLHLNYREEIKRLKEKKIKLYQKIKNNKLKEGKKFLKDNKPEDIVILNENEIVFY